MEIRTDGMESAVEFYSTGDSKRFAVEAFACYGLSNGGFVRSVKNKKREGIDR